MRTNLHSFLGKLPFVGPYFKAAQIKMTAESEVKERTRPWRRLLLQLGGSLILVGAFFVIQTTVPTVPGLNPPVAYGACTFSNPTDYYRAQDPGSLSYTSSRSVFWEANIPTCWQYAYHLYSFDGTHWTATNAGTGWTVIATFTVGSDGHANSLIGNTLHLVSCSGANHTGTCGTPAVGSMDNDLIIDATAPSVWGSAPGGTTSRTIAVSFGASDATSGVSSTTGYYYNGGWQPCGTLGGTSGTFYCTGPSDGTWTVGLQTVDNAGNYSGIWQQTVGVDTIGPSTPSVSPSGTLYTNATSGTVTWSGASDNYSGIQGYYVNYHWATPNGAGGCTGQGGDSGWQWVGNTTSWTPGWGANTCFQYQAVAKDNYNNWGGGSGWSAWIISDQQSPPTTISTSTPCLVPGQSATFTVGRTDPAPSSGWGTWANASTSWWNGTEDPWSGAWRNDPWLGNTNATATYNVGVPTPTVGTQATYNRVVWTQDNSRNTSDGTSSQGRNTGANVTVDNTYPSGLSLSGVPATTNSATVSVTTHSTAGGCAGVSNVAISNNGTNWIYSEPANGTVSWDITNATYGGTSAQGTHTIYVSFFEGTTWNQISTTVVYDTSPPATPAVPTLAVASDTCAPSHCPASGGLTSITNGLIFSGSAEAGSAIKVYADGNLIGTGTATSGSYSITTTTAMGDGLHAITIKATDVAGNTSSASTAYTVVVHTTCPN